MATYGYFPGHSNTFISVKKPHVAHTVFSPGHDDDFCPWCQIDGHTVILSPCEGCLGDVDASATALAYKELHELLKPLYLNVVQSPIRLFNGHN